MARSFNGLTSNFLNVGSAVVTSLPITMSAWFNCTSQALVSNTIISISNTAFSDRWYRLVAILSGTTPPFALNADVNDGFGNYIVWGAGNNVNSGTWYHGCVIFTSLTSRVNYLNGGSKTTNSATQSAIVGLNATCIGLLNRPAPADPANALIDKVGIWNIALTDAEVLALANGALPSQIRPAALVGNWPVDGLQSPEPDYSGAARNMVINGTVPVAAGSPTMPFTPRWPRSSLLLPTAGLGWIINRRNKLMVPKKRA